MNNDLHFAVVIGINCYPGIRKQLTTSRHDAERFASWLAEDGGLPDSNIKLIVASASEEKAFRENALAARPIRSEVFRQLRQFHRITQDLSDSDWRRTRLYLYAAAHGLVPGDGRGAALFADYWPGEWLGEYLDFEKADLNYSKNTYFAELVLLYDCCREVNFALPPATSWPFDGPYRGPVNRVQAYAAEHTHQAFAQLESSAAEYTEARGFFTAALLEGLKGLGPHDPYTGVVTSNHIREHIEKRVPELTKHHQIQRAELIGSTSAGIEFTRLELLKYPTIVRLPEFLRGKVRITYGPPYKSLEDVEVEGNKTVLTLPEGRYVLVASGSSSRGNFLDLRSEWFGVGPKDNTGVVDLDYVTP